MHSVRKCYRMYHVILFEDFIFILLTSDQRCICKHKHQRSPASLTPIFLTMAISGCGTFTLSGLLKNYICSRGDIFISILEKEITLYFMHYKKNKEPEHAALEELIQLREQNSDPH